MIQPLRRKISTPKVCGDGYAGEVGFRADVLKPTRYEGHRRLMSVREGMTGFSTSEQLQCRLVAHNESLRAKLLSQGSAGSCEGEGEGVTRRSISLGLGAFSAALAPEKEDFRGDFELHEFITDAFSGSVFMRSKLYGSAYTREYLSRSNICAEDQAP